MTVHLDQADTKYKHNHMTCRACVKLPLYVDGIDASIESRILKYHHNLLVYLAALDYGRNPYIFPLKKEMGDIFSEYCTKSFKLKILLYINEVLFTMVKTALKDKYPEHKNPIALKNEVATCQKIYHDEETRVMVNPLVNEFYTQFLFKFDVLPQDAVFPLDIDPTFFNNFSPDVIELLI